MGLNHQFDICPKGVHNGTPTVTGRLASTLIHADNYIQQMAEMASSCYYHKMSEISDGQK